MGRMGRAIVPRSLFLPIFYFLVINMQLTKEERCKEFIQCLDKNIAHDRIKKIVVFYDAGNENKSDAFLNKIKSKDIDIVYKKGRLTYKEAFTYANERFPFSDIIVANADIYFNETLNKLDTVDLNQNFLCLTRWNMQKNGKLKIFYQPHGSHYSQDAWIFKTPLKINFRCSFKMGLKHCDSSLNYHLKNSQLNISNPCLDIQACHLHISNCRNDGFSVPNNHTEGIGWSYLMPKL